MKDHKNERAMCATCQYYEPPKTGAIGSCHEGPIKGQIVPGPSGRPEVLSFFPDVAPDNWCGKHLRDPECVQPAIEETRKAMARPSSLVLPNRFMGG